MNKCLGCGNIFNPVQCHNCNQTDLQFCIGCHNAGNTFIHRYKEPVKEFLGLTYQIFIFLSLPVFVLIGANI